MIYILLVLLVNTYPKKTDITADTKAFKTKNSCEKYIRQKESKYKKSFETVYMVCEKRKLIK